MYIWVHPPNVSFAAALGTFEDTHCSQSQLYWQIKQFQVNPASVNSDKMSIIGMTQHISFTWCCNIPRLTSPLLPAAAARGRVAAAAAAA
jgi:hypothetical protein